MQRALLDGYEVAKDNKGESPSSFSTFLSFFSSKPKEPGKLDAPLVVIPKTGEPKSDGTAQPHMNSDIKRSTTYGTF